MSGARSRGVLFVLMLVLVGALAWGVGWVAHGTLDRQAVPSPTATVRPTATATSGSPPTIAPSPSPEVKPPGTLRPTSTPLPTLTPAPTLAWEVVQRGEGLYQVCRRHCPGRWPAYGVPSDLDNYAREVARLNRLTWPPHLYPGQKLQMPPCPQQ